MSKETNKQTCEKDREQDRAIQLFEAFSGVDEELLYRSEKNKTRVIPFRMMGMAAACMFMLLVGGAVILNPLSVKESDSGTAAGGAYPQMYDSDTTENDMQNDNNLKPNYELFLTDTECNFINVANKLLQKSMINIKKVNL